ncbi:hypothetical protein EG832_03840, partial [bacterium]|nr:hypothetical protein [bacterium]
TGTVVGDLGKGVPLAVTAVTRWKSQDRIAGYSILPAPGSYFLFLPEGRYQILVFADLNRSMVFERHELISTDGKSETLTVEKGRARNGIVPGAVVSTNPANPRRSEVVFDRDVPARKASLQSSFFPAAEIITLADERFEEENGSLGLYDPSAYFEQVNGFFFMLEEYDPEKVPLILIHGIRGTPRDWEFIVDKIDRTKFQPWFFYYPSGLKLDTVAEMFYELFLSGKIVKNDQFVIAAHSQGGLIARSALEMDMKKGAGTMPQLFISFCTPYGGVESAESLGLRAPVIVPSWVDLAVNSDYMKTLYQRDTLAPTKFHLFFGYGNSHLVRLGANDDGVISLKSQLDPRAQNEAVRIHGFNETHSEMLLNKDVVAEFTALLESVQRKSSGNSLTDLQSFEKKPDDTGEE